MVLASPALTGWYIGFGLAAVVVLLVAVLVLAITATVKRIADVADDITGTLVVARERTEVLWQVATTNRVAGEILETATAARTTLEKG